ncbi:MAM domain-containing protein [Trichostrongylus colubriformis]|uniref:MAM domain-containing protein n=1 Tax=Trichostrongylus colubriformis TaxID=6319 RepID=A0AAN8FLW2_TRICO
MGDGFQSSPLVSAAAGKPIRSAADLDCNDFVDCRWRGGAEKSKPWRTSSSTLPPELLFNMTGSYVGPEGRYALLYIEQDSKGPLDYLRSDPISCQSQTENTLLLRFWKTLDVELEACAVSLMGEEIECYALPSEMSPAPVSVSFITAAKNFEITIRVRSFNPDFDSLVVIDEISYRATLCSDALSVFDLGEHFLSTPMLSLLLNRNVDSAKELACDFSRRAANCVWGSTESTTGNEDTEIAENQWTVGHGPLNQEKFYSLTGHNDLPDGEFAVARMETGGSTMLLSEVIRCVVNDVSIQFNLWLTGTAKLQVCLVDESTPTLLDCQPAASGPVVVDLPRIERPFRIALRAESPDQGMVIVDDIRVQGDLCPSVLRQYSSKSYHPLTDQPDPNACRLLSCDFSRGHACLYDSSPIQNSAPHNVIDHSVVARLDTSRNIAILESPVFHLNTIARLHFTYTVEGEVVFFVCNDSANKELESCFKVEGRDGEDFIEMLPSDTKVYLIAKLSDSPIITESRSGQLSIHRLQLTDTQDINAC